jgi:hypothetical protein
MIKAENSIQPLYVVCETACSSRGEAVRLFLVANDIHLVASSTDVLKDTQLLATNT